LLDEQLIDSLVVLARVLGLLSGAAGDAHPARGRDAGKGRAGERKKRGSRPADDDRDRSQRWSRDAAISEASQERGRPHRPASVRHDGDAETEREQQADGLVRGRSAADGLVRGRSAADGGAARPADVRLFPRVGASGGKGPRAKASATGASRRRHDVVERGAQVRVLEGPFAGKVGVVHELDGRGGARVMMGLLAVRIDVANLEVHVEGRRRPVLSTSHRKPVPARS
jgi:hypothetical protein